MSHFLNIVNHVDLLSPDWDKIAKRYYQKKEFISHCHEYNPCSQRYYELYNGDSLEAWAIVYTLKLNVFTYAGIPSPLSMNVIGIPASVGVEGVAAKTNEARKSLLSEIIRCEKGFILGLNFPEKLNHPSGSVWGKTLPTVLLKKTFNSADHYLTSLRSDYRRRIRLSAEKMKSLKLQSIRCADFTHDMYRLYLQVFEKSEAKLEKLSFDFFKNLPAPFSLRVIFDEQNSPLAFHCSLENNDEFDFFMGGVDYSVLHKYDLYFNITSDVVQQYALGDASYLDMGQTAETPKLRLGGLCQPLYMFGYHPGVLFRWLFRIAKPWLEYRNTPDRYHVFPGEND
ncbi:MAG: GNAT family N-acetyltransferase [Deltaproteobacteria bacterium]|nr:GNAT family N-acetyltransferase [Deltaproteobacteria bacterium]